MPRVAQAWRARFLSAAVAVLLAALLPGCGSNGNDPDDPETLNDTRSVGQLEASFLQFTLNRSASVDVSVDWGSSANDVDVYVTLGTCVDLTALVEGRCTVVVFSESGTAKPERVSYSGSSGGTYKIFALNLGPNRDNVTITAVIR